MDIRQPTDDTREHPFYIKAPFILLGLILVFYVMHILASILVPLAFACLIAILLNPLNTVLEQRFPRNIAISLTLTYAIIAVAALLYILSRQILGFSEALPAIKEKFITIAGQVEQWINAEFGISIDRQVEIINGTVQSGQAYVGQTLNTILGAVSVLILLPIYVFFLLFYKPLILDFIFQAFSEKHSLRVAEILAETKSAIQSYVIGLLTETAIVAAMNSAVLLVIGVRSAILLGVIGGLLNMIPYLGGIVAVVLPMLMVTITKEGYSSQIAVFVSYMVIQFIDNNILSSKIVSSKVQINSLVSIIIVLMGGALWGFSGMFLSIPFLAILKIIFDRVDGLKPWGLLFGTKVPDVHSGVKFQARLNRIFRKLEERGGK